MGGVHHPFYTVCGGRLKLYVSRGRWTRQALSFFPDPGFSRPGSAKLRSARAGRPLAASNGLAPYFLPGPGGIHGRRIWLEGGGQRWPEAAGRGQGQRGQEASGRPPHPVSSLLAPLPGRLSAEGRPNLPSLPSPAPPRIPEVGAWCFLCIFYLFSVRVSVGGEIVPWCM